MAKRIGLLTGGSDAPGQNVCLKALVYNAIDQGFEVIGIRKGWEGLLHYDPDNPDTHGENVMPLTKVTVRDIDRASGSFLHSSRLDPAALDPALVPPFALTHRNGSADLSEHLKRVVDKLQLAGLVVLGDRSALAYAARLSRAGVPLIGIPKTVHNNVAGSDYALGFSTALGRGVHFIHEIRAIAGSREEIAVVEILGRNTGLTTLLISLLSGADRALIPEVPFEPRRLAALLRDDQRANPNNYAILVMSEAASIAEDRAGDAAPEWSRPAPSRGAGDDLAVPRERALHALVSARAVGGSVSGSGAIVTEILENTLGQRLMLQPLSYLIRSGEPDGQDLLGALNFARLAIDLMAAGKTGRLVAYRQRENYVDLPIEVVTQPGGNVPVADYYDTATYSPRPGVLWAARV